MSEQVIASFLRRLAEDKEMRADFIDLAAKYGFDFLSDELQDSDLEDVTGGTFGDIAGLNKIAAGMAAYLQSLIDQTIADEVPWVTNPTKP